MDKGKKSDSKRFQCEQCSAEFVRKTTLMHHMKTHQGTEYYCKVCCKAFWSLSNLSNHSCIIVDSVRAAKHQFRCHLCGMSFAVEFSLTAHLKYHNTLYSETTVIPKVSVWRTKTEPVEQKPQLDQLHTEKLQSDRVVGDDIHGDCKDITDGEKNVTDLSPEGSLHSLSGESSRGQFGRPVSSQSDVGDCVEISDGEKNVTDLSPERALNSLSDESSREQFGRPVSSQSDVIIIDDDDTRDMADPPTLSPIQKCAIAGDVMTFKSEDANESDLEITNLSKGQQGSGMSNVDVNCDLLQVIKAENRITTSSSSTADVTQSQNVQSQSTTRVKLKGSKKDTKCKRKTDHLKTIKQSGRKKIGRRRERGGCLFYDLVMTSERPHVCDVCGMSFRWEVSLGVHQKQHNPKKQEKKYDLAKSLQGPYVCDLCGRSFRWEVILNVHKKQYHELGQGVKEERNLCDSEPINVSSDDDVETQA